MQREVLLITGPGGDAQGWGNMAVTEVMAAFESAEKQCVVELKKYL